MSLECINNYSTVNEQLREMTTMFLNSHSSLTINALAQRSGVAPTTLRRLLQDDSRNEIAPHTVLSLVSYLLREKNISIILKKATGPVGELLKKSFSQFIFESEKVPHKLDNDLNEVFKDKLKYLIYKLAANVKGSNIDEIKNNFGLHGLNKLDELISDGWIIANKDESIHAKEKNFTVDLAQAQELTHVLVDQYKVNDVEKGYNLFYSLSEGLNAQGIQAVKKIEIEAVKKVFEVMNNKEFIGSIPYFSIFMSDVIGISPFEELKKEVLQ
jgi:hypothetical protein